MRAVLKPSVDCLKCIAWKGRAVVVGFAGGAIEQVDAHPSLTDSELKEMATSSR
jgi:hypothetical protein